MRLVFRRDPREFLAARHRHGVRGRVLHGRVQVDQPDATSARGRQRVRPHPGGIALDGHHLAIELQRCRAQPGVSEGLGRDAIPRTRQALDERGKRRLRPWAHHDSGRFDRAHHLPEPARTRDPVRGAPAAQVIRHQQMRVTAQENLGEPATQHVVKVDLRGRGRHVHAHVDHGGKLGPWCSDEGAERAFGVDQVAPLGLGIRPRDGGQVDAKRFGQIALRRHAVARSQSPVTNGLLDVIDDLLIPGATPWGDSQCPLTRGSIGRILHGFHCQKLRSCMGFVFD